jgi:hypothetical protein
VTVESELLELKAELAVAAGRLADGQARLTAILAGITEQPPDPAPGPVPLTVTAVPGVGMVTVTWVVDPARTVAGITVARGGEDGGWFTDEPLSARSRTFDKLTGGEQYEFLVDVEYADGTAENATVTATPTSPPVVVTPAGSRRVALVGRSGLRFNSIVFAPDISAAGAAAFGVKRGRPMDGLMFFTPRQSWSDLRAFHSSHRAFVEAGNLLVVRLPHAPEPEGSAMNQKGADDAYRTQQRDFGAWLASAGFNVPNFALSVDWECNGDWYAWSANRPGGASALRVAIRNFVTNVRAGGATRIPYAMCFNKGPSQAGADFSVFPGSEFIDVIGVDQYDMWQAATTSQQWATEINRSPALGTVRTFAESRGIQWSLDEGGNSWDPQSGGRDNPAYWGFLWDTLNTGAASMAWHCTYIHPGAPSSLRHDFGSNPRSWETYRAPTRWGG